MCASGRINRHFHYTGSRNYYSQQQLSGESWSLDIFGLVPQVKECYLMIMIDSVLSFMIAMTLPSWKMVHSASLVFFDILVVCILLTCLFHNTT